MSSDANKKIVHIYVASQAAMAAEAYDPSAPNRANQPYGGFVYPDLYSNYPYPGGSGGYFAHIDLATDVKPINYFNPNDYALGKWETDQNLKPDLGYGEDGFGFYTSTGHYLSLPADTYQILAFADPARSKALGAQSGVAGSFDPTKQVNLSLAPYSFGTIQDDHSAQFVRPLMTSWNYWSTLLHGSFGL